MVINFDQHYHKLLLLGSKAAESSLVHARKREKRILSQLNTSVSSWFPNTRKKMKARDCRESGFTFYVETRKTSFVEPVKLQARIS